MTGQRVVLAADEAAGARALKLIERSEHELVAIAANAAHADRDGSLWAKAEEHRVPCYDARRLSSPDFVDELEPLRPDVLLNIHSLPKVCGEVLDAFGVGAWNLHPGPLPEAAGINVPSWAIALGHAEHGVTLHRMTVNYDEGEITFEDRFPIRPDATGLTLSAECGSRGLRLVAQLIDLLAADPGGVPGTSQDLSTRRYYGRGQPDGGLVDWSASTAAAIDAHVRAADFRPFDSPWSPPRADIAGTWHELIETEVGTESTVPAGTTDTAGDRLRVAATDRWVTIVEAREVAGPCQS